MRLSYVMLLMKKYMLLGVTAALLASVVMIIAYAVYRKKYYSSDKTMPWFQFAAASCLVCYCSIVICATMLGRGKYTTNMADLGLFATYKKAWYTMEMVEWRDLVLNILMFCPIGFLLPFTMKCFKKWRIAIGTAFLFTLFIESVQYILKCGVFEVDDLIDNVAGAMIGFGIYVLIMFLVKLFLGQVKAMKYTICCQIPLLVVLTAYFVIWLVYSLQSYGNLSCEYIIPKDMKAVSFELNDELGTKEGGALVQRLHVFSNEEAFRLAQNVFWSTGKSLSNDYRFYDTDATFYSMDHEAAMWVYYQGGRVEYEDYSQQKDSHNNEVVKNTNASKDEIKTAIEALGFYVPADSNFQNFGNGTYQLSLPQTGEDGCRVSGTVICSYTCNDMISSMKYYMVETESNKKCKISSEKEAYEKIVQGKFSSIVAKSEIDPEKVKHMKIISVEINKLLDTKGYFQPVYHFYVECDGVNGYIDVPARIN